MEEVSNSNLIIISPPFQVVGYKKEGIEERVITITNGTNNQVDISTSLRDFFIYEGKFQPSSKTDPIKNPYLNFEKNIIGIKPNETKQFKFQIDWSKYTESEYKYISFSFKATKGTSDVGVSSEINSILAIEGIQSTDKMTLTVSPEMKFPIAFVLPSSTSVSVKNTGNTILTFNGEASLKKGGLKTLGKTIDSELITNTKDISLPGDSYTYNLDWSAVNAFDLRQQIGYYSIRTNIEYGPSRTPISVNYEFFYFPWWLALTILIILSASIVIFKKIRNKKIKNH